MPTTSRLRHRARRRSALTREPHQQAVRELTALGPAAPLVPAAATAAQEQLEWWLLHTTAWPPEPVPVPLGIERVTPLVDGLDLHLTDDSRYLRWFTRVVLPTVKDGAVHGIPGLRVVLDHGGAPVLHLAGTNAQVRLRGFPTALWRESVDAAREDFALSGFRPLWTAPLEATTAPEAELAPWFSPDAGPRPFRIASALLRRVGLFAAAGTTACLTGWTTWGTFREGWKFDFEFIPGHRPDHDRLLSMLTDPDDGLPLRITARSCNRCPGPEASCRVNLVATDGTPGEVTLLFRTTEEEVVRAWEQRWPAAFARIRTAWGTGGAPKH
ncbi:hypothetical protein ACFWXO_05415 [Kitasatospora sp. NPDC059088]|uniref:hypothetical protein n=1 Tax=Kitasatospora sp. NPDC059088 TaxID=3346722 RepID=UPI0036AF4B92